MITQTSSMSCRVGTGRTLFLSKSSKMANRRPVAPMNAVKEVFMPALSSTMTEGKIVSWLKAPGDKVSRGEALVVVESGTHQLPISRSSVSGQCGDRSSCLSYDLPTICGWYGRC